MTLSVGAPLQPQLMAILSPSKYSISGPYMGYFLAKAVFMHANIMMTIQFFIKIAKSNHLSSVLSMAVTGSWFVAVSIVGISNFFF